MRGVSVKRLQITFWLENGKKKREEIKPICLFPFNKMNKQFTRFNTLIDFYWLKFSFKNLFW